MHPNDTCGEELATHPRCDRHILTALATRQGHSAATLGPAIAWSVRTPRTQGDASHVLHLRFHVVARRMWRCIGDTHRRMLRRAVGAADAPARTVSSGGGRE